MLQDPSRQLIQAWAEKINAAWRKSLEAIFEVGDLLIAAKAEIGHGNWCRMCESQLKFTVNTAQRLMRVAEDKRLRNTALGQYLPRSWRTLFELSQWDDESLVRGFENGRIHPEMTKADAANLLTPRSPPSPGLKSFEMLERPITPRREDMYDYDKDALEIFLEYLEAYFPTVPKIELFRRTGPRKQWQSWGVEVSECPGTRTINIKVPGEHFIIRLPERTPAALAVDAAEEALTE